MLLTTKELAKKIKEYTINIVDGLKEDGKETCLCLIRIGDDPSQIAYEKSIRKYAEEVGVTTNTHVLGKDTDEDIFVELLENINEDADIDGVLIFKPLPEQIDPDIVKEALFPFKDIDGVSGASISQLYDTPLESDEEMIPSWLGTGFAPCTAEACLLILDSYGIDPAGKKVVIMGRSNVIGRPLSLMLLNRDATVTVCHSKTKDITEITKEADILVVAVGKPQSVGKEYVSKGQTVIDVGIHVKPEGGLCGDVIFDEVEPIVENLTPVPGGVGGLTTSILVKHVADASLRFFIIENEIEYEDGYEETGSFGDDVLELGGKVIKFDKPRDDKSE